MALEIGEEPSPLFAIHTSYCTNTLFASETQDLVRLLSLILLLQRIVLQSFGGLVEAGNRLARRKKTRRSPTLVALAHAYETACRSDNTLYMTIDRSNSSSRS